MKLLDTLKSNWGEIVVFLLLLLGLELLSHAIAFVGAVAGLDLSTTRNFLSGFARVSGVMASLWLVVIGVSFKDTVEPYLKHSWISTFRGFSLREQFYVTCGILATSAIVCALCFSLGF